MDYTAPHGSTYDHHFFTLWQPHYSSFLVPNFFSMFQQHDLQIQGQIQVGYAKMWFSALKPPVSRRLGNGE